MNARESIGKGLIELHGWAESKPWVQSVPYDTRGRKRIPQELEQETRKQQAAGSGVAREGKVCDRGDERCWIQTMDWRSIPAGWWLCITKKGIAFMNVTRVTRNERIRLTGKLGGLLGDFLPWFSPRSVICMSILKLFPQVCFVECL